MDEQDEFLEVDVNLVKYIHLKDETSDGPSMHENFDLLRDFIKKMKAKQKKAQDFYDAYQPFPRKAVMSRRQSFFTVLQRFRQLVEDSILAYIKESTDKFIALANELIDILMNTLTVDIDAQQFIDDMIKKYKSNEIYYTYKSMRKSLEIRIQNQVYKFHMPETTRMLRKTIKRAFYSFDHNTQYLPATSFDNIVSEYMHFTKYEPMIEPTTLALTQDNPKAGLILMAELADSICENTRIRQPIAKYCVYAAVVRAIFNEYYSGSSELNMFNHANLVFLIKCEALRGMTVGELGLPKFIEEKYTRGLPIGTLYNMKHVESLKEMELMTNPLDLMLHLYRTIEYLARYFGAGQQLNFSHLSTLLMGLMAISPPVNAVSIAKFLFHWNPLCLSAKVGRVTKYFVAAVERIYSLEIEYEDDETDFTETTEGDIPISSWLRNSRDWTDSAVTDNDYDYTSASYFTTDSAMTTDYSYAYEYEYEEDDQMGTEITESLNY